MKIAIVGADEKKWKSKFLIIVAKQLIEKILKDNPGCTLVSGACPKEGVDIWAEEVADKLGVPKEIYIPESNEWKGYRKRNIEIAEVCDKLACIEPYRRNHSGGMWTMKYAEKLGKPVRLFVIKEMLDNSVDKILK